MPSRKKGESVFEGISEEVVENTCRNYVRFLSSAEVTEKNGLKDFLKVYS
jgi:hypothetical protein